MVAPGPRSNLLAPVFFLFGPISDVFSPWRQDTPPSSRQLAKQPIIMYSMFSYLFSGFAPCGALPLWAGEAWLALGAKDIAV